MVNSELEVLILITPIRNININQDCLDQVLDAKRLYFFRLLIFYFIIFLIFNCCGHRHNGKVCPEFCVLEPSSEFLSRLLSGLLVLKQIYLVHSNDELVHQYLAQGDALGGLSLNELLRIDDQHHEVNNACTTNDSLH